MGDEFAGREELSKLWDRVDRIDSRCIACQASVTTDIKYLTQENKELKKDMSDIKLALDDLKGKVQALTVKISIAISIIVTVVNFVVPYLIKKFG